MFGYFIIQSLEGNDAQGAAFRAKVKSQMDNGISGELYLPPYMRPNQSNIKAGSVVYGYLDETTGVGAAFYGADDADFMYFFDADIEINKTLTVKDNITSTNGDVIAEKISLKTHKHIIDQLITPDGESLASAVISYQSSGVWTPTSFSIWSTKQPTVPIITSENE